MSGVPNHRHSYARVGSVKTFCAACVCFILQIGTVAAQIIVPDPATCTSCEISLDTLVTFGSFDGPGSLYGVPNAVHVDQHDRYWVVEAAGPPKVFGSDGQFVTSIGRFGAGPGEFRRVSAVLLGAGDSVVIIDSALGRATVIGPDQNVVRQIRIEGQFLGGKIVHWPDQVILNGILDPSAAEGFPLHLVSLEGTQLRRQNSFGSLTGVLGREPSGISRLISAIGDGTFWSAAPAAYVLSGWTRDGERVTQVERETSWFPASPDIDIGTPTRPPAPKVGSVEISPQGYAWVVALIPAPTWRSAWPTNLAAGATSVNLAHMRLEAMYNSRIELVDPRGGRVIVRFDLEGVVVSALPGGRFALYTPDADGTPRISVVAATVQGLQ